MNIQEILSNIPYAYPFLLVDRVTSIEQGKCITAYKNVTFNEPYFQGHFKGNPVMPGVLILEALAQANLLMMSTPDINYKTHVFYFVAIDNVRFYNPVIPGDRLELICNFDRMKLDMYVANCKAIVDNNCVAKCIITGVARNDK